MRTNSVLSLRRAGTASRRASERESGPRAGQGCVSVRAGLSDVTEVVCCVYLYVRCRCGTLSPLASSEMSLDEEYFI